MANDREVLEKLIQRCRASREALLAALAQAVAAASIYRDLTPEERAELQATPGYHDVVVPEPFGRQLDRLIATALAQGVDSADIIRELDRAASDRVNRHP